MLAEITTTAPTAVPASLWQVMAPELILISVACVLFLLGVSNKVLVRRAAPVLALLALGYVFIDQLYLNPVGDLLDPYNAFRVFSFAVYVKMIAAGVGFMLVLLAWPTNDDGTGNSALNFGQESGEFFALMLLSIAGVFMVAGARDIIVLFLGFELAAIPTYIMVAISRPLPVAQEAGVKYFFLGALAAAMLLFGFSYLYGTTGTVQLDTIMARLHLPLNTGNTPATMPATVADAAYQTPAILSPWQALAAVMIISGFAFKMAAAPLHFYAGDVYQGAATPVTAFLSFIPKASGFVGMIKILYAFCGPHWIAPPMLVHLLFALAVLTMFVGNVLGLLQHNIKRLLAYSSIAHSGYMLVGITALMSGAGALSQRLLGLEAVLFYLAVYGIMNVAAFAVLMMLPASDLDGRPQPATSAETFEDIAGQGRRHVGLGLAMAVACFSLIGLPLTAGFFGKFVLIRAAWVNSNASNHLNALVIITVINAAIGAAYYLRIVGAMFLRPRPGAAYGQPASTSPELPTGEETERAMEAGTFAALPTGHSPTAKPIAGAVHVRRPTRLTHAPILMGLCLSILGTLVLGVVFPTTDALMKRANAATSIEAAQAEPAAIPPTAVTPTHLAPVKHR